MSSTIRAIQYNIGANENSFHNVWRFFNPNYDSTKESITHVYETAMNTSANTIVGNANIYFLQDVYSSDKSPKPIISSLQKEHSMVWHCPLSQNPSLLDRVDTLVAFDNSKFEFIKNFSDQNAAIASVRHKESGVKMLLCSAHLPPFSYRKFREATHQNDTASIEELVDTTKRECDEIASTLDRIARIHDVAVIIVGANMNCDSQVNPLAFEAFSHYERHNSGLPTNINAMEYLAERREAIAMGQTLRAEDEYRNVNYFFMRYTFSVTTQPTIDPLSRTENDAFSPWRNPSGHRPIRLLIKLKKQEEAPYDFYEIFLGTVLATIGVMTLYFGFKKN